MMEIGVYTEHGNLKFKSGFGFNMSQATLSETAFLFFSQTALYFLKPVTAHSGMTCDKVAYFIRFHRICGVNMKFTEKDLQHVS